MTYKDNPKNLHIIDSARSYQRTDIIMREEVSLF